MSGMIHELPKHIPFLPPDLREDALSLMHKFFAGEKTGKMDVDLYSLTNLKDRALAEIDASYLKSTS